MKMILNFFKKESELKIIKQGNEIRSGGIKKSELIRSHDENFFIKPRSTFDGLYMRDAFSINHKFF